MQKFFTEAFDGVLITDFWAAYDSVDAADRQKCLPHLLRELEKVDQRNDSAEWQAFAKKLRRLLRDPCRSTIGHSKNGADDISGRDRSKPHCRPRQRCSARKSAKVGPATTLADNSGRVPVRSVHSSGSAHEPPCFAW